MLMPLQVRSLVRVAAMLSHSAPAVHVARSAQARSVVVAHANPRTRRLFASFSYFRLPFLPTASIRASTALQLGDLIGWKQVCSIREAGRGKEVSALVSETSGTHLIS